jgi:hypothetical protein
MIVTASADRVGTLEIKNMRWIILPLCAIAATACRIEEPLTKEPAENNKTYKVEYLFEHDGCKVYRFWDRGQYIYFTNCNGDAFASEDSVSVHTARLH